jgi:hypothetical protein
MPDGDPRGLRSDHAAADHHDLRRADARHAAHQDTAPAIGLLQRPCAHLRRKAPRDLRHRRQKRQGRPNASVTVS